MDVIKARELAQEISDYFFVTGMGERAERLAIILPGNHEAGGWSQKAVKEHIFKALSEAVGI
jgi:hypothetical protein